MMGSRWTILLYTDADSPGRQFTVRRRYVRRAVRGLAALSIVVASAFGWLLWEGKARLEVISLSAENRLLEEQLRSLGAEVEELGHAVAAVTAQDIELQALTSMNQQDGGGLEAGLIPIDFRSRGRDLPHALWAVDSVIAYTAYRVLYDVESLRDRADLVSGSLVSRTDSLRQQRDEMERMPSILPTRGSLTSRFSSSRLHPIFGRVMPHEGLDISAPMGTPIVATAKGRVIRAHQVSGYGNLVEIDHGAGIVTRYAHASRLLVRMGQEVQRGDPIAEVGRSGSATSTHLHYEVLARGVPQNPERYLYTQVPP